ncbi:MAG: hypothetical protein BECKG1743D_GA0114223_113132 [Candidatus Kentron sp. G]|nr:MAG: hypothetical protein BECKG1743E_GA0114224_112731 [Candidatus Kentron sp. G]VFN08150.1 MAG: hypothetical protein BECKG1743D_GA0114223_113132 [Candidatus Kentron sp. G]
MHSIHNAEDPIGILIIQVLFAVGIIYLLYRSWRYRTNALTALSRALGGRVSGQAIIGSHGGFDYIIHFAAGYSGGGASGPARAGYPSSMRIIVEKKADITFRIYADDRVKNQGDVANLANLMPAAGALFAIGFKEIAYDGATLDIKLYPASLDGRFDKEYFQRVFPSVETIVDALDRIQS